MNWHEDQVNALLAEYLALQEELKIKGKRYDEIRNWCKAQGTFATDQYVCAVKLQTRVGLAGLETVTTALGREILEENDLIRESEFLLVSVSPKSSRVEAVSHDL